MKFITLYGERLPQREITVYLENGDYSNTTINGTVSEIVKNYFNVPIYYSDSTGTKPVRARAIVFHNEPYRKRFPLGERRERLIRIWNLSDEYMKRNNLFHRNRVEVEIIPDNFSSYTYRDSWAYLDGDESFDEFEETA